MRRLLFCVALISGIAYAQGIQSHNALFIYDEDNEQLEPYRVVFNNELKNNGFTFKETSIGKIGEENLSQYDLLVIHSAVMAFNAKSPVRDWLKSKPSIANKKVSILVTANRWFLNSLYSQQLDLLKERQAVVVDALSAATKKLSQAEKEALIRGQVGRIADRMKGESGKP